MVFERTILNVRDFFNFDWFDINPQYKNEYNKERLTLELGYTLDYYENHYFLKKLIVRDNDLIVGFLIWTIGTKEDEEIENEIVPYDTTFPVVLSVGVHPEYRKKGILKKMLEEGGITSNFIVHTNPVISSDGLWKKFGCIPVKYVNGGQKEFCFKK